MLLQLTRLRRFWPRFCQHCRPLRGSLKKQEGWPLRTLTWQVSCRWLRVSVWLCVLCLQREGGSGRVAASMGCALCYLLITRVQGLNTTVLQRRTVECRSVSQQPSSCQLRKEVPRGKCCRGALWQQLPWVTGRLQPGELHTRSATTGAGQWHRNPSAHVVKMQVQSDAQQSRGSTLAADSKQYCLVTASFPRAGWKGWH